MGSRRPPEELGADPHLHGPVREAPTDEFEGVLRARHRRVGRRPEAPEEAWDVEEPPHRGVVVQVEQAHLHLGEPHCGEPHPAARKLEAARALGEPGGPPGPLRILLADKRERKSTVEKMLGTQLAQVEQLKAELALRKAQNSDIEQACAKVASEIEEVREEHEQVRLAFSAKALALAERLRHLSEPTEATEGAARAFETILRVARLAEAHAGPAAGG